MRTLFVDLVSSMIVLFCVLLVGVVMLAAFGWLFF
jgi:hypothetical protein